MSDKREFYNALVNIGKLVDPVADCKHDVVVNNVVVVQVDPKLATAIAEAIDKKFPPK